MTVDRKPESSAASFDVHYVDSWQDFLALITDSPYSNWAFRGQADARWPLFSTLSRYLRSFRISEHAWARQEQRILRIFKRKGHHFLHQIPDPDDDFRWLALMQQHGAPTRLLDFTWSPYVAAFFALERATEDAAVWAVNARRIREMPPVPLADYAENIPIAETDPREPGHLRRYYMENRTPFVWIGEPLYMDQRLIAQSGTFALPSIIDEPIENILARYTGPAPTLVKIILRGHHLRDTGMRELYRMNITHATLFPGLDGLGRSLAHELEFHWAYDPRTMQPYD